MDEKKFFALEIREWENSKARMEMLDGERYYSGDHDILKRIRTAIGNDGKPEEVKHLPNTRLVDNLYAKHVDQKKNYLLGKPVTFESKNKEYAAKVSKILGRKFMRTLKNAGLAALNTGIAWLYPYYDDNELKWRLFSGSEILPFWRDEAHTEIDCAVRLYDVEEYVGTEKKVVRKAEIFTSDGIYTYTYENGTLIPDEGSSYHPYIETVNTEGSAEGYNWEKIPLIPIKYNAKEIPLIRRARSLQDAINLLRSDFANNMQENKYNTILVVKNYDGTDPGEFRHNLLTYGMVKIRTTDGVDGGVDTLAIEVNAENYKTVLDMLKTALIENMRSFDGKDERLNGSPNQMNIQSMYSDIDLDANDTETELQAAFEEILWFVNQYLANSGQGDYDGEEINVIFNRDVLINEGEAIDNCQKSAGLISDETIVSQHPWVNDPAGELERLKKQKEEEQQYNPFPSQSVKDGEDNEE
ncbi:MAG: phage portal protein [Oscillospiraceae bacterium]|nr:phage portal protein [Oscillospiraceae bacterium]